MDFTPEKYKELLDALRRHNHVSLRHDVDLYPERSLRLAKLEAQEGFQATYYFRVVPESYNENIIQQIVSMGHTAGYHYEDLATCDGDMIAAYENFCRNLEKLRKVVPITTACAHGSPKSKWNSQEIFMGQQVNKSTSQRVYDIHALGIEYEPMLDTDFSKTLYLTDTGRRWDGYRVSVRDKVPEYQEQWQREGLTFHTSDDIIQALRDPKHLIHQKELLINTHPQRWIPFGFSWIKEMALQSTKNVAKRTIIILNQNKKNLNNLNE